MANEYNSIVEVGKYQLKVKTVEKVIDKEDRGLEQTISLVWIDGTPSFLEEVALTNKVVVYTKEEVHGAGEKGSERLHGEFVDEIKKDPHLYTFSIPYAAQQMMPLTREEMHLNP